MQPTLIFIFEFEKNPNTPDNNTISKLTVDAKGEDKKAELTLTLPQG